MIRPTERHQDGWIILEAPLPENASPRSGDPDLAEALLETSETLRSGFKVAACGSVGLRLRAERPESQVTLMPASLDAGVAPGNHGCDTSSESASIDLPGLCREAGWAFEARSDGALVVDLGVRGAYVPAIVEARPPILSVEVPIVSGLPGDGLGRRAVAVLLLRANGAFRMACGRIRSCGESYEASFAAVLSTDASALELDAGLSAVAVASQHCAIEARMLASDEEIARAYLRIGGGIGNDTP